MAGQRRNPSVPDEGGGTGEEVLSTADLIADSRRRLMLGHLQEHESCPLTAIAEEIVKCEAEGTRGVAQARIRSVYLDLQRNHLPPLVDAGLVQYDGAVGQVSLAENGNELPGWLGGADQPDGS